MMSGLGKGLAIVGIGASACVLVIFGNLTPDIQKGILTGAAALTFFIIVDF